MEERAMIERHLASAELHVVKAERHVEKQRELLTLLDRDGHESAAALARELLATFEDTLAAHAEDRDRLRAELAVVMLSPP